MADLLTDTMLRALRRNIQRGAQKDRLQAVQLLSSVADDDRAVELLLEALEVEDPIVQTRALAVLTRQNAHRAIPRLVELLDDPDPELRRLAVQGLGKMRAEEALLNIAQRLEDTDPSVRLEAVEAVSWQNEPWIAGVVVSLLYDVETRVRRKACEAFATGLAPLPLEDLFITLGDPDEWVRFWSVEALRLAGDDRRAVQGVLNRLYDRSPLVQERAAKTLGYMRAYKAHDHFEKLIADKHSQYSLLSAINEALENFDDEYSRSLRRACQFLLKQPDS